jgi:hypothetical protein
VKVALKGSFFAAFGLSIWASNRVHPEISKELCGRTLHLEYIKAFEWQAASTQETNNS